MEENRSSHVILMVLRDDREKQLGEGKHNPTTAAFGAFKPPRPGLHCAPLRVRLSTQHTQAVSLSRDRGVRYREAGNAHAVVLP